jgi:thiamine kinase-like enzyme
MRLYFLLHNPKLILIKKISNDDNYCSTYLALDTTLNKCIFKISNNYLRYSKEKLLTQKLILEKINCFYNIPTNKLIKWGYYKNNLWITTSFLNGNKISQSLLNNDLKHLFFKMLNNIHSIVLEGFGYITTKNDLIVGEYLNWNNFLLKKFQYNIQYLYKLIDLNIFKLIKKYFYTTLNMNIKIKKGVLLHNDIKSDNLIYNKKDNTLYIIDWEEAIVGDKLAEYASILNKISNGQLPEYFKKEEWCYNKIIKFYRLWFLINEIGWLVRHYQNNEILIKKRVDMLLNLIF